jgi:hypothetical protein
MKIRMVKIYLNFFLNTIKNFQTYLYIEIIKYTIPVFSMK